MYTILGILIDEIKALPIVRNRDFKSFEILSFHVNDFHDRLRLMGLTNQADNSYVLKELEGKLNQDVLQKWLESLGNRVEQRRVEQLMTWLENQTKLRRISNRVAVGSFINFPITNINTKPRMNITYVGNDNDCMVCLQGTHDVRSCPKFLGSGTDEKWDIVKKLRLCFQCLSNNHHRDSCTAPKCKYCARPHDSSLHNIARTDRNQEPSNYMGNSASYHMKILQKKECITPPRCYLPVLRATVMHKKKTRSVLTILDSGSELNVISTKLCNKLGLTGVPIVVNIIGVAANVTRLHT